MIGGNSAFPRQRDEDALGSDGLTKREFFAAAIISSVLTIKVSTDTVNSFGGPDKALVKQAVKYADALIAELAK